MLRSLVTAVAFAAAAVFLTVATTTANAAPLTYVYGNYGTIATSIFSATVGYVNGVQNNTLVGQGFSVGATPWDIQQIDVGLASSGTGTTDPRVYLYSDNAGVPGSQLSEFTLSGSPVSTSKQTFFFTGSYSAQPSTNYWVLLKDANAPSQSSFEWYLEDSLATPTARNSSGISYLGTKVQDFTGGLWTDTLSGLSVRVQAVAAVPEPPTYALAMVAGVLGASAAARRRTKNS
jgi:hypothetical protein